ncbi:hypothetical protein MHYP_G00125590 [Metynnis hypsauchen]
MKQCSLPSSPKVVKKLSGENADSAEWFTSIGNEHSQIVSFVLTCEETAEKLQPMCRGVMNRFRLAYQPVPKICTGPNSCGDFQPRVDNGMVVPLDIFHWIHQFDAAIRTEFYSKEQLKHHVWRVTLGAQESFRLVHLAIEELKRPAGLDENGVCLFKTPEAIDEMCSVQQRHRECIQDQPDMNMYRVARTTTINNVDVPYHKCLRGNNTLEGFQTLPNMIPGPHCAAQPYQVYLISGIARWNSDWTLDAVFGGRGRYYRIYSAPLIDRLNTLCQQLFGETVEENRQAPADVPSNELLGLEYLISQSTGESFSLQDIVKDGPSPEEAHGDALDADLPQITLTSDETSTVHPPAFVSSCVSC